MALIIQVVIWTTAIVLGLLYILIGSIYPEVYFDEDEVPIYKKVLVGTFWLFIEMYHRINAFIDYIKH